MFTGQTQPFISLGSVNEYQLRLGKNDDLMLEVIRIHCVLVLTAH